MAENPSAPTPDEEAATETVDVDTASTETDKVDAAAEATDSEEAEAADGDEASEPPPPKKPPEDPRDRRIRELMKLVDEKDELLRDYIKAHKQAQAQWEAYKQRLARDREDEVAAATAKIIEKFLAVSDNMERSLQAAHGTDNVQGLLEGMELVYKGFTQVMTELGLTRVDPVGQPFDPTSMEALGIIPVSDKAQDNTVVNVLQAGFAIGDREIRPALVQVGKFSG